jgi:hypothetical protein
MNSIIRDHTFMTSKREGEEVLGFPDVFGWGRF